MLPRGEAIREELRREAAQVHVPADMWKQISARLEQDRRRKQRYRQCVGRLQALKPVLGAGLIMAVISLSAAAWPEPDLGDGAANGPWEQDASVAYLPPLGDNLREGYHDAAVAKRSIEDRDRLLQTSRFAIVK